MTVNTFGALEKLKKTGIPEIIFKLIFFAGLALAVIQFIFNRSLWQDEASLALNIINRNFSELFITLKYGQAAPVLFLEIEKLFSLILPNSELGLRLFPLFSYFSSLFFLCKILIKVIPEHASRIISLSLFVFSVVFIRYSSEVKQYMSDTMVSLAIFYLLINEHDSERKMLKTLSIVGIVAIFITNIAPVVLLSAAMYLIHKYFISEIKNSKGLVLVFAVWGFSFIIYYFVFIHNHPLKEYMVGFWSRNGSFLPLNLSGEDFGLFVNNKTREIFEVALPVGDLGTYILLPLFVTGIFAFIIKRKTSLFILCIIPIIIHLFLSAFKIYPFATRLILYLIPLIIITIGYGLMLLFSLLFRNPFVNWLKAIFIIIPLVYFVFLLKKEFPVEVIEAKKSLAFLVEHKKENDALYADAKMANALKYYIQIKDMEFSEVKFGDYKRKSEPGYIQQMAKAGRKLWILLGPINQPTENFMLSQLDKAGISFTQEFAATGTSVWLADFGQDSVMKQK